MRTSQLPSYDEVVALPALVQSTVDPGFIDINGHMNIRHYLDHGALGADVLCREVGIDDAYRAERRLGVFTAEHHIKYLSEMHEGDEFSVHSLCVERSAGAVHMVSLIVDRTDRRLSCVVEILLVHVGLDTRRPSRFPDDVAAALDTLAQEAATVPWPLPLSGAMGIRR